MHVRSLINLRKAPAIIHADSEFSGQTEDGDGRGSRKLLQGGGPFFLCVSQIGQRGSVPILYAVHHRNAISIAFRWWADDGDFQGGGGGGAGEPLSLLWTCSFG